jgi:RDD family
MSGSYGGGDRQRRPERQREQQPDLQAGADEESLDNELDSREEMMRLPSAQAPVVPMDFGKRLVAAIIDLFVAYVIGTTAGFIPFINDIVAVQLVMVLILLVRDDFYGGRGIGKNLMGLRVVGVRNNEGCTMLQSFKRNIVLFAAPLILYIATSVITVLHLMSIQGMATAVGWTLKIVTTVGFMYIAIVIPAEAYRAYSRADGRRFGDQLAGTKIVDAPMDFSSPLPNSKRVG